MTSTVHTGSGSHYLFSGHEIIISKKDKKTFKKNNYYDQISEQTRDKKAKEERGAAVREQQGRGV